MAIPTKEQLEKRREEESLNRAVAFAGVEVPLFGGALWIRQMTFRDAAALEIGRNPLVCGGLVDRGHAFNFLAYMLGWRGARAIFKRVWLRRFLAKRSLLEIRRELHEYSDVIWQDRVMPSGDTGKPKYSVHYCGHIAYFCARHFGMSYAEAMNMPIPVFHQLRRAWYHANGRAVEIMDESDKMEARIIIAQAQAERMNTNG